MSGKYIGIDIGTSYVKTAGIEIHGKKLFLNAPSLFRSPLYLIENGRISDAEELRHIIVSGAQKAGIKKAKSIIVLNDSMVITREIVLPMVKNKEMDQMVKLEVQSYLPGDISEYTVRYRILSQNSTDKSRYAIVTCVKTQLVNDIYELFKKTGFTPVLIDTPVNSLIKYTKRHMEGEVLQQNKKTILLNLGASSIDMVVFQGKVPVSQQVINFNSQRIDVIISNTFNIDRLEAEQYKIRYGLYSLYNSDASEMSRTIGSMINNQLDTMMGDLYRRIHEHITGSTENPVNEIILTGGLSGIIGFEKYLSQAFSIPCHIMETEKCIQVKTKKPGTDYKDLDKGSLRLFTGVAGAAFRGE